LEITLNSDPLGATFVGIKSDKTYEAFDLVDGKGVINPGDYDYAYLIIKNTDFVNAEGLCKVADYSIDVTSAIGDVQGADWSGTAENFSPPIY
jgi:hypothetical protein